MSSPIIIFRGEVQNLADELKAQRAIHAVLGDFCGISTIAQQAVLPRYLAPDGALFTHYSTGLVARYIGGLADFNVGFPQEFTGLAARVQQLLADTKVAVCGTSGVSLVRDGLAWADYLASFGELKLFGLGSIVLGHGSNNGVQSVTYDFQSYKTSWSTAQPRMASPSDERFNPITQLPIA